MERRTVLAIALSLLVLLSWSALVSKFSPALKTPTTEKKVILPPPALTKPAPEPETSNLALFNFAQEKMEIIFSAAQATMREIKFKDYQDYKFSLGQGFLLGDKDLVFKKDNNAPSAEPTFVYQDGEKQIVKRFLLHNSSYTIDLDIEVKNLSQQPIQVNLPLILGALNFTAHPDQARFQDVTFMTQDKPMHLNPRKDISVANVKFVGLRDRYFCAIIQPEANNYTGFIQKINPQESEIGLSAKDSVIMPGQQVKQKFYIYLGPQDLRIINTLKSDWTAIMYYGTFDFISHLLLQFLEFLYSFVHNWGWAIIILSVLIYFLLYPLTLKQMRSMKEMQTLQPHIEELRKVYKDNPQRLNKEIMALYQEHKVNPFGGCLPLILQIPVFFALYQALIRSINLKGASFLWIKDLSGPDKLFSLSISGNKVDINILPILMAIGMFIQQKLSLTQGSASSQEQQKLMMVIFPMMFGFIFYNMPSGLVLYWFINSTLMLFYQIRTRRLK
jgi:YidC/Oxa1 family membrane protein insertase